MLHQMSRVWKKKHIKYDYFVALFIKEWRSYVVLSDCLAALFIVLLICADAKRTLLQEIRCQFSGMKKT